MYVQIVVIRCGLKLCLKLVSSTIILCRVKQFSASCKFVSHGFDPDMVFKMLVVCCIGPADFPQLHLESRTAVV